MTKLTTKKRKALPKAEFGLPDKRAFPVENKSHAANAKARASQQVKAGNLSKADEAKIDKKADIVLGKKKKGK